MTLSFFQVNEAIPQSKISGSVLSRNCGIAQFPQNLDLKHFFSHSKTKYYGDH